MGTIANSIISFLALDKDSPVPYLDTKKMDGLKLYLVFLILFGIGMSVIALPDDRRRARKASLGH